jgi:AcrR family transcriptional regulator
MVGHEPERRAVEPSSYGCSSWPPADATRRLEQHLGGQPPGEGVGDASMEEAGAAAFAFVGASGHAVSIVETSGLVNGQASLQAMTPRRPHTGRRRNDAAERAILHAAAELLAADGGGPISVAAIAERAGVGKQTIYRWWPSKSAVLLDAMIHRARQLAPAPDGGDLHADLRLFLRSTFAAAPDNRSLLLGVLREALADDATMDRLSTFTAARRDELARILDRARVRGQIPVVKWPATIVDQAFGLLWYRMIFAHEPLDEDAADELAAALAAQLRTDEEG